jgi:plastocyanin
MRRAALTLALAILVLAWPGASALAEDQSVTATNADEFVPRDVTVLKGETVTWHNSGNHLHNAVADDGSFRVGGAPVTHDPSGTNWTDSFTFNEVGTFRYYCEEHGDEGGVGMAGKVIVKDPNAPGDTTPPAISSLRAKPAKFCTNKSETCDKRGTRIKFSLSEDATVTADVRRKGSGSFLEFFAKHRQAGGRTIKFSGKGLKPGKYVLRLRATDAAGNASKAAKINVRVVKNG